MAKFVEILTTFNSTEISFIKSILDASEINYYFKGEHALIARPIVEPARLMVQDDQVEEARLLLKTLIL